jgi:prepilin-type N-terminal cleavage/methylation domain-containing protein
LRPLRTGRGFTLVELAVVLAIVALLLGSLMYILSAQLEQRNFEETRRRLEAARELLLSYAIVGGRLPCPASTTSNGDESPAGGGACTDYYTGFLPAKAIGFQSTDTSGYALDAYGNRIRYAVSSVGPGNHFTTAASLKSNGITTSPNDLVICAAWGGSTTTCGTALSVTNQNIVAAVVWSQGKNFATLGAGGVDEAANNKTRLPTVQNNHPVFVSHTPTRSTAANGEFDDYLVWIAVGELYGRLISAGVLP